jgi:hypothetical protein
MKENDSVVVYVLDLVPAGAEDARSIATPTP